MNKAILAAAMLCFILHPSIEQGQNSKQDKPQTESGKQPSVAIASRCEGPRQASDDHQKAPEGNGAVEWADWALVLVGAFTGWAVWRQAKDTAESAKAMNKQVALQEMAMAQWVEIVDWTAERTESENIEARVEFNVINPTAFILTVRGVNTKINGMMHSFGGLPRALTPKASLYVQVTESLTGEQVMAFLNNAPAAVDIHVSIKFEDARQKAWIQDFGICLVYYRGKYKFSPLFLSEKPSIREEKNTK